MDNFVVSARKYRPGTFDSVVGQSAITNTLKNAIKNNHIGQSFLFCGPRGVGKTTCARIFAKTINCEHPTSEMDPCGHCDSCLASEKNASFNIYELDAASNRNVESMRHLIEQVRIPPQMGKYSVYIIDEVHMLTTEAFNTFLKTLEEPPAYAKFILATTEKNKIIPTILSRCQIFDFRRIGISDIVHQLSSIANAEGITADEEALRIIAQKADGGMRDALSMFDQIVSFSGKTLTYAQVISMLNILDYEYYFKICGEFFGGTEAATLNLLNEIWENGFDPQDFLSGLSHHLRNLLIMQDALTIPLLESSEELRNRYAEQAKKSTVPLLLRALDLCAQCDLNYRASNHKRLLVEILLLQLCELLGGKTVAVQPVTPPPAASSVAPDAVNTSAVANSPTAANETPASTPAHTSDIAGASANTPTASTLADVSANAPSTQSTPSRPASPPTQQQAPPKDTFISLQSMAEQAKSQTSTSTKIINQQFMQRDLDREWKIILTEVKTESPSFHSILANAKPVIRENTAIEIIAENDIQEKEITNKIKEIRESIRQKLQNDLIEITVSAAAVQAPKERRPYTAKEKFDALNKTNPQLQNFKNELDLEIEM
ncbi:MAG: DNA polymerase III subunit gamma/tau [Bacteroidales bacterium]|nr:DNA polymerase III subunit gamma/tau [Bacteroidales bacterium]